MASYLLLQVMGQWEGLQGCDPANVKSQKLLRQDCRSLLCIHTCYGLITVFSLLSCPWNARDKGSSLATIQVRIAKDGTLLYRCRVQRRGYPVQSATFPTKQEARWWGQMVEGEIAKHMAPFGFFDVLVLAIGGHFLVKIITTWLKTREGVMKRQVQQLENRLRALETQQVANLHKRLSVLEEVFVLDDVAVQRKLRQALGDDPQAPTSLPPNGRPPKHA